MDEARLRWEERADWPNTIAALVFLAAWSWPILDRGLASPWKGLCWWLTWATWAIFALDYVVRFCLAERRWAFLRESWLDLAIVVLPVFRPLRLLRVVKLLNILNRHASLSLRGRVASYVGSATVLVLFVGSVAVLSAERGRPGANIQTFPDALWWSITTITTAGYGDRFPVTFTGRCVAVGLMLCGIALLGVVTAFFASWLIRGVEEEAEEAIRVTASDVEALIGEVRELRDEVRRLRGGRGEADTGPVAPSEHGA